MPILCLAPVTPGRTPLVPQVRYGTKQYESQRTRERDTDLTVLGVTRVPLRLREHKAGCKPPEAPEKTARACSRSFSLKPWPLKSSSLRVWYHFWVNRGLPFLARVKPSDMPYRPR